MDESYVPRTGHYLLACVVLDDARLEDVRAAVLAVRRHRREAFHWHDERPDARRRIVELAATVSDLQIVVVVKPVGERRQERARTVCTASLLAQLQALDPPVVDVSSPGPTCSTGGTPSASKGCAPPGGWHPRRVTGSRPRANRCSGWSTPLAGAAGLSVSGNGDLIALLGDRLIHVQIPATL